ncbi:inosine/xanthosine triphosphatase [Photobacterium aphoticum]|uniref:Inosine/xanthosine triphosphatase n=1 Tax=Photobacterium aphoticum TaxID=754436 RepID=A0A0J1JFX2_9GAMM|nr:inosine/xanthosine triphosphatase [Photobacterium aphoticum]KLV00717.1 inositol monophosphatase [Photobacterium aphoticum]PSU58296.1 non-canonical purine NTP phosphatase [Photobacterium aphoticum]GHA50643.1 non-canonical purine NTP phosphatase [Photobacterium aphoticum]
MPVVIVASTNPAKISAVEHAFAQAFPDHAFTFHGVSVASGVSEQPMTADETLQGARTRVHNAKQAMPDADYYVGLEAGLDGDLTFAWMVIEDARQRRGEARSASLPLPPAALAQLHQGQELGDVMDAMFNQTNIKQKGGAIALLTHHLLSRSSVYQQALILALIPFMHPDLFPVSDAQTNAQANAS